MKHKGGVNYELRLSRLINYCNTAKKVIANWHWQNYYFLDIGQFVNVLCPPVPGNKAQIVKFRHNCNMDGNGYAKVALNTIWWLVKL